MALLAAVYGSPADASSKPPPAGPLSGIVTAASIGATGAPVGEAETFSPDTHEIVAIVPIGKISHSEKLDVVWSSLNAAGSPTVLLRQRIRVTALTVAYSTATVTGTLTVGNYEVKATLGSRHVSADWNVAATAESPASTSFLLPSGTARASREVFLDAAGASPLTSGPDGTVNPLATPPGPSGTTPNQNGTCQDMDFAATYEPLFNLFAAAVGIDCDSPITISAAENDVPLTVIATSQNSETAAGHTTRAVADVNMCSLPGDTNAPGTVVRVVAEQVGHPQTTMHTEFTLEDSGPPLIGLTSSRPRAGSKVSSGQAIAAGIAYGALPPAYPLSHIDIYSNTDPTPTTVELGAQPVCAENAALRFLAKVFLVPHNPPPFYTITATVYDTHGRSATATASWPTGDEWTGTAHYSESETGQCTSTDVVNTTLDLVVAGNDTFSGTATLTYNATRACGNNPPTQMRTFPVTGLVTGGKFHFDSNNIVLFNPTVVVVPITGSTATAQFSGSLPLGSWTASVNLKCKTC
jgi:hypothetical protein